MWIRKNETKKNESTVFFWDGKTWNKDETNKQTNKENSKKFKLKLKIVFHLKYTDDYYVIK